jgi:hypothetical protein
VEVYVKPRPSTEPSSPADHYLGYCTTQPCALPFRDNYVEHLMSLNAQASFALRFVGLTLPGGGDYDVYAQVDVAFDGDNPDWGRYMEASENNNIYRMTLGSGVVHMPFVAKNH